MVVHVYNPSYSGGGDGRILVQAYMPQKLMRPYLKNKPAQQCTPVVPASQEADIGVSKSKDSPGQKCKTLFEKQTRSKWAG
jgi:hypothetical protein